MLQHVTHRLQLSWLQGTIKELESKLQKKTPSAEKAPASMDAADKGERQHLTVCGRHGSHPEQKKTWAQAQPGTAAAPSMLAQGSDGCRVSLSTCLCVGPFSACHLTECRLPCPGWGISVRGICLPASDGPDGICYTPLRIPARCADGAGSEEDSAAARSAKKEPGSSCPQKRGGAVSEDVSDSPPPSQSNKRKRQSS